MSDNLSLKEKLEAEGGELSDETILLIDEIKNHDLKCHRSTRFYIGNFILSGILSFSFFYLISLIPSKGIWLNKLIGWNLSFLKINISYNAIIIPLIILGVCSLLIAAYWWIYSSKYILTFNGRHMLYTSGFLFSDDRDAVSLATSFLCNLLAFTELLIESFMGELFSELKMTSVAKDDEA